MRIYNEKGIKADKTGVTTQNMDVRVTKDKTGVTLSIATTDTQLTIPLDRIAKDLQELKYI